MQRTEGAGQAASVHAIWGAQWCSRLALPSILLLALALRLYGIDWGLPAATHPDYSYHPDEAITIEWARLLSLGIPIDKHFIYGGTSYYILLRAFGFFGEQLAPAVGAVSDIGAAVLIGRIAMTAIAVMTIGVVYEAVRQIAGRAQALGAAFFLAILPAHIVWAQRVRPDALGTLLAALFFYLAVKILVGRRREQWHYYLATGVLAGLTAATRLPLIVFMLLPLLAHWISVRWDRGSTIRNAIFDRRLWVLPIVAACAYVIASPHSLLYPDVLVAGIRKQWSFQTEPFEDAIGVGSGIYQYGWLMLRQALGYGLYVLAAIGLAVALWKRTRLDLLLLAGAVPYLLITSLASWVVVRYTLPATPFLAVLAARAVFVGVHGSTRLRVATMLVTAVAVIWTLWSVLAYLRIEASVDVRDEAAAWIEQNAPKGSSILRIRHYMAPPDEFFNPPMTPGYKHVVFFLGGIYTDSAEVFERQKFDYLVLNEATFRNMERLGDQHPRRSVREFRQRLNASRYVMIKEFNRPVVLWAIDFSGSFASTDYVIPRPRIRIYAYR